MLYLFFIGNVLTAILLIWQLTICQVELQSTTAVITKATNCHMQGLKWLMENVTTFYQHPRTYLNVTYRVLEDIKRLPKGYLHIERCNDRGYDCEDFQNWRIDNFCQIISRKNQIWSELIDKIQPPFRCPVKKAVYEAQNASIDISSFKNWYPGVEKYLWKAQSKIMNEENSIVYCGIVEAYFQTIRKQDRTPLRKPKHNMTQNTQ